MIPTFLTLFSIIFALHLVYFFIGLSPTVQPFPRQASCRVVLQQDQPTMINKAVEPTKIADAIRSATEHESVDVPTGRYRSEHSSTPRHISAHTNGYMVYSDRLREMMVAVVDSVQLRICSGTLISPTWVLTSAHCQLNAKSTRAIVGSHTFEIGLQDSHHGGNLNVGLGEGVGEVLAVKRVINHPKFTGNLSMGAELSYDIALVELSHPSSSTSYMRLNTARNQLEQDIVSRSMGYERTLVSESGNRIEVSLRQFDVPILPGEDCELVYPFRVFSDRHLCTGHFGVSCSVCTGDGGGPLFLYDVDENAVQVGISLFGSNCGAVDDRVVHVRTDALIEWIFEQGVEFNSGQELELVFAEEAILREVEITIIPQPEQTNRYRFIQNVGVLGFFLFFIFSCCWCCWVDTQGGVTQEGQRAGAGGQFDSSASPTTRREGGVVGCSPSVTA